MATIGPVQLEITLVDGGAKARATVDYRLTFTDKEARAGFRYRELCYLTSDDRNSDDWLHADPVDLAVPRVVDRTTTATDEPIVRHVVSPPFDAAALDEDLGRDEIRARVRLIPSDGGFVEDSRRSQLVSLG